MSQPTPSLPSEDASAGGAAAPRSNKVRFLLLALFLTAIVAFYFLGPKSLSLEQLAHQEAALRQTYADHPALFLAAALLLYIAITGLSLPGAAVLSLVYGWLFGFWVALPLVSFGSTTGATLAFLSSRYFFRDAVRRRYAKLSLWIDQAFASEGWVVLLTLRLVPQFPFFVVNLLMGLTPIRVTTYWWASQLGMLPATCVFVFAGASSPGLEQMAQQGVSSLVQPKLLFALALLGLIPVILRWLTKKRAPQELA